MKNYPVRRAKDNRHCGWGGWPLKMPPAVGESHPKPCRSISRLMKQTLLERPTLITTFWRVGKPTPDWVIGRSWRALQRANLCFRTSLRISGTPVHSPCHWKKKRQERIIRPLCRVECESIDWRPPFFLDRIGSWRWSSFHPSPRLHPARRAPHCSTQQPCPSPFLYNPIIGGCALRNIVHAPA